MTPDDMADYHQYMAEWAWERYYAESNGLATKPYEILANSHDEAYQYWCRQANPGREKARENG